MKRYAGTTTENDNRTVAWRDARADPAPNRTHYTSLRKPEMLRQDVLGRRGGARRLSDLRVENRATPSQPEILRTHFFIVFFTYEEPWNQRVTFEAEAQAPPPGQEDAEQRSATGFGDIISITFISPIFAP